MIATKTKGAQSRSARRSSVDRKGKETKLSRLETMLRQPHGATVEQLGSNLGWQPHTIRAAVSILRKDKKLLITLTKVPNGGRAYRVEE